jgi:hypothetical protein
MQTTEDQKEAILAVLTCSNKTYESEPEALDAAAAAVGSALRIDLQQARLVVGDLKGLDVIETFVRTLGDVAMYPPMVTLKLTNTAREQLKSDAHAWIKSEYEPGCKSMGISPTSIPWFEPASDDEIARIALDDSEYRDDIAKQIRQQIQQAKARGHSA